MYAENLFDLPDDLAPILIERDIMAGKTAVDVRREGTFSQNASAISLKHSPRTDLRLYRENFLETLIFNQKDNYVEIEKSSLSVPLPNADPHKYELFRQQWENGNGGRSGRGLSLPLLCSCLSIGGYTTGMYPEWVPGPCLLPRDGEFFRLDAVYQCLCHGLLQCEVRQRQVGYINDYDRGDDSYCIGFHAVIRFS